MSLQCGNGDISTLLQDHRKVSSCLETYYNWFDKNLGFLIIFFLTMALIYTALEIYKHEKRENTTSKGLDSRVDYLERVFKTYKKRVKRMLQKNSRKIKGFKRKSQEEDMSRFEEKLSENSFLLHQIRDEMKEITKVLNRGQKTTCHENDKVKYKFPQLKITNLILEEQEVPQMNIHDDRLLGCLDNIEEILNVANRKAEMKNTLNYYKVGRHSC